MEGSGRIRRRPGARSIRGDAEVRRHREASAEADVEETSEDQSRGKRIGRHRQDPLDTDRTHGWMLGWEEGEQRNTPVSSKAGR